MANFTTNDSFLLKVGEGKILISAAHNVDYVRNGVMSLGEKESGKLALLLHEELNVPVIIKTAYKNDDANFDMICPYKDAVVEYVKLNDIKFVLDLHQLPKNTSNVSIDICVANFKNIDNFDYLNVLIDKFSSKNIGLIQIDTPFNASNPGTVSSYVRNKTGVQAIQIEMNSDLFEENVYEENFNKVYLALKEIVEEIN